MQQIHTNKKQSRFKKERASAPGAGYEKNASVTVEASFGIPLFLFAVLCLIWMIEIHSIRISIINAAQSAAKRAAEETAIVPVLNISALKADIINGIGIERVERSILDGGSEGIQCKDSWFSPDTGEMYIKIKYKISLPLPVFGNPSAEFTEDFRINGWRGYEDRGLGNGDADIVYITENGLVYHEDPQCTYLQLSINFVPYAGLSELRNSGGAIYHRCEKCVYGPAMAGVYITETGGKYHNSLRCSGLKRTVRAVKKSEVIGKGGCYRCTK